MRDSVLEIKAGLLLEANENARRNWECWSESFNGMCEFKELSVLQSPEVFMGFLYEFSLLRNHTSDEARALQLHLKEMSDFGSVTEFEDALFDEREWRKPFQHHRKGKTGKPNKKPEKMGSMCSKLACLWQPEKFAMWDRFARLGIWVFCDKKRELKI